MVMPTRILWKRGFYIFYPFNYCCFYSSNHKVWEGEMACGLSHLLMRYFWLSPLLMRVWNVALKKIKFSLKRSWCMYEEAHSWKYCWSIGSSRRGSCSPSIQSTFPHIIKWLKSSKILFLCGEDIDLEFVMLQKKLPYSRRNHVHKVEKLSVTATFIDAYELSDDEWGQKIIERLITKTDLVIAVARHRDLCYKRLYRTPSTTE